MFASAAPRLGSINGGTQRQDPARPGHGPGLARAHRTRISCNLAFCQGARDEVCVVAAEKPPANVKNALGKPIPIAYRAHHSLRLSGAPQSRYRRTQLALSGNFDLMPSR